MTLSWFGFFRGDPLLDATALDAVAAMLRGMDGMRQGFVLSRTQDQTAHPFPDNEPAPALVLQLQFDAIEALEAAIAAGGPLSRLPDAVTHGRSVTQQAMLTAAVSGA